MAEGWRVDRVPGHWPWRWATYECLGRIGDRSWWFLDRRFITKRAALARFDHVTGRSTIAISGAGATDRRTTT